MARIILFTDRKQKKQILIHLDFSKMTHYLTGLMSRPVATENEQAAYPAFIVKHNEDYILYVSSRDDFFLNHKKTLLARHVLKDRDLIQIGARFQMKFYYK